MATRSETRRPWLVCGGPGRAAAEQAADGKKVGSATTEESLLAGAVGALVSAERMGADEPVTRARP